MPSMSVTTRVLVGLTASLMLCGGGATATAAPIDVPWSPDTAVDTEVEFVSDGITYYGSLRPSVGETRGAALLLPGSGPIDRNGNVQAANISPSTIAYIADALAQRGITTLRFDKIGAGRTGTDGLDPADPPGFTDQVDAAEAAAAVLSERTGISGDDFAVLGHSEGGLTALALADRGVAVGKLGLLAPLSIRYFDLLHAQLNRNFDLAVSSGQATPADADVWRGRLDETIAALRAGEPLPYPDDEVLAPIGFDEESATFLTEADALDPAVLAARLPSGTDVLLTCSDKDLNVSCGQTDVLFDALQGTDVDYARFTNASHMLAELGPLPTTGFDMYAPLPQSSEFRGALDAWVDRAFA
ncbi:MULTISPECIES: S9 family peptidase [unclassified Rhodococcus (in: high G+C Gram-positive bacteria)]|uniref:alpha/beta hydrolase family protein n=2 Tax=unclassified Rhodococcus (in: high G+C Gram-positive bacteria) TaxID=192944 RepID=UPI0021BE8427|nr:MULTISPECIES: alpha/beta fold hydrolase [unclassified Rhodococcus (in: high G+C Gram-positive bacteria)]